MPTSPRSREARLQQVVDVAMRLFDAHGYAETTVQTITEVAGISPRSFYRYFDAKDGVLAHVGEAVVHRACDQLADDGLNEPSTEMLAGLLARTADEGAEKGHFAIQVRLVREHPELLAKASVWRRQWADELAQGLADLTGDPEPSFEQQVTSALAMAITAVAMDEWLAHGPDGTLSALVEEVLEVLRRQFRSQADR